MFNVWVPKESERFLSETIVKQILLAFMFFFFARK